MQRRAFLTGFGTLAATAGLACPALAQSVSGLSISQLRGSQAAAEYGVLPNTLDDQSTRFQAMVDAAAQAGRPVFLPAGTYVISNVRLPDGASILGVAGRTQLVYGGNGFFMHGRDVQSIHLEGLVMDGANQWQREDVDGLIDLRGVLSVRMRDCAIRGASHDALYLEQCGGAVAGCDISGAARFGLFSMEGRGLRIDANTVHDCGNGGIIIHRWQAGHDGTIVTHNRIYDIAATNGGTGQWGNGINLFRTHDNFVSGNIISRCAFSAFRANSTERITVTNNLCRDLGETALFTEFAFKDAVITGNQIDGAANGISVTNFNDGGHGATVAGNIVRNMRAAGPYEPMAPGFGIGIAVEADASVTGNVIENCALYGINAGWGPYLRDCLVSANVIGQSEIGIGISAAPGAGMAMVTGNAINARKAAIIAHEWARPVSGDLAVDASNAPSNIVVGDNKVT